MTKPIVRLGDEAMFAGQHYILHGMAESLTALLTFALTLRDLDALRIVIAPIAAQGYAIWCQDLECCLDHQKEEIDGPAKGTLANMWGEAT